MVVIVLATAATLVVALTTTFSTVISSLVAVLLRTLILLMMLLLVMVLLGLAMLVGRLLNRAMTIILLMIMLISLFVVIAHEPWLHLLRINLIDLAGWAFLLRCISHLLLLIASAFGSEVDEVTASLPARLLLLRLTLLRVLGLGLLLVPEWLWLIFVCERLFS